VEQVINSSTVSKISVPGVKRVVAVASGKGGVGKSTVAANLALALAAEGQRVGLLDADIYGPSQGLMMGVPTGTKPKVEQDRLLPILAHGLQCMSMSFVASDRTPAIWRGPMASGALQQLLTQTDWQAVDVLVVDMPPGTGDIQLTMAQNVPLAGAVIVTTPQDIALLDARKGIEMFRKVAVPLFGIVENMSTHVCRECGHQEAIFGEGGGDAIATEYGVRVLARLPLSMDIRQQADGGRPPLVADPDGTASQQFRGMAREILTMMDAQVATGPLIQIVED
jgi:ATP-binding protein involved in chromosome partitioning